MNSRNILFSIVIITVFILSACGGASTPEAIREKPADKMMEPTEDVMTAEPTEDVMMPHDAPTVPAMTDEPADAMVDSPAWFSATFTDARTGAAFAVNDFKGKVILVETMAVWCSKCYQQQEQIKALHGLLAGNPDFVSVTIDIDPNEDLVAVQSHVSRGGFDWLYAVAPPEVSRELAALYGPQFLNPPSVPVLLIDRHGVATPLPFGVKSADQLLQFIQPLLEAGM